MQHVAEPLYRYEERATLLVLSFGTLAVLLFAALNDLAPRQAPLSFALVFLGYGLLFYAAVIAPILTALGLVGRLYSIRRFPRIGLALLSLLLLTLCSVANPKAMASVFHLSGPARFRLLVPLAFSTASASLVSAGWLPARRLWAGRLLAAVMLLLSVVALWPESRATEVSAAVESSPLMASRDPDARFVLVGLDGADWHYIEPLIARGDLPNIASLRERGMWGPLKTFKPTKSPVIWTTIATGRPPSVHGIRGFTSLRLQGVDESLERLRLPAHLGFERLYSILQWCKLIYRSPVVGTARQAPAYWELASLHGAPVDVVNWWATWPAEPILGHVVSERTYYFRFSARGVVRETSRLTYPEELYRDIEGLMMRPDEVRFADARPFMDVSAEEFEAMMASAFFKGKTIEHEFKFLYSMHETTRRVALRLIDMGRRQYGVPADLLVLFPITDLASHSALAESELVENHLGVSEERRRKYARVVSEAYRAADRAIGEIAAAFGPANVLVISDHGFQVEEDPKSHAREYHHMRAPDGIFVAAGPAFGHGRVEGLTVYDVLPLLAYLKGFPVAEDLSGHVPLRVFAAAFAAKHSVVSVASYGTRRAPTTVAARSHTDAAVMDHLRALGYVK
jgi:Type I phosphodiesterase / nucleotide pyrophosphatase